ncbi:HDIG domain-containing protein [Saccharothrix violaceirubra]|uniref:HD/PDEase domain-containing protein n=1 Tax=Saccharothrix violaceirubra TaxID=413306 RepID=A0A7W7T4P3_9PSEU|nr:HD domain-containing protein [Saccharothrix violaceirubra]MBB4966471.1 hypothetical protein [Saccharothrix violaceirubra]
MLLGHSGNRWRHTVGVAHRAAELAAAVPEEERDTLVAAAWLHDIGYAIPLVDTGFHPLDGARHLDRTGWRRDIADLVAHHSGARFVAREIGLEARLSVYPWEITPLSDALAYADQTVDSTGERVSLEDRLTDMLHRHGPRSANARAHAVRAPYLRGAAERVEARLPALVAGAA